MLMCFVCRNYSDSTEQLFQHIKKIHRKCEKYQCTEQTCVGMKFSDFSNFKKHVIRCFGKRSANEEMPNAQDPIIPPELFAYAIDEHVLHFESSLNRGALELACSLAANMSTPRCEVYATIEKFKKFYLTRLITGWKIVIFSHEVLRLAIYFLVSHVFINCFYC